MGSVTVLPEEINVLERGTGRMVRGAAIAVRVEVKADAGRMGMVTYYCNIRRW